MKTFFKKLEYRFLVESTKIENSLFPYKTAISEANVKTNGMLSTKWTYHKERSFAANYLIFLKILFSLRTSEESWFDVPTTCMPIFVLFVSSGVLFESSFCMRVSLKVHWCRFQNLPISLYEKCMSRFHIKTPFTFWYMRTWDVWITRKFLGLRKRNFQGIVFIWTQTCREIFKSALMYL